MRFQAGALLAALMASGMAVACSETTGPDGPGRTLGILQLGAPESVSAVESAEGDETVVWSVPPGDGVTYPPEVIEAPSIAVGGQAFQVIVYTIGPNGCWAPDGMEVVQSDHLVELTPWDRHSGADVCTEALAFLPHAAQLTLLEAGEWKLRIRGRRVVGGGSDYSVTAERTITVGPDYSSQQPFEVVLRIGEEILVDHVFGVGFEAVTEDSRCPADVLCVWQGNAAVRLGLTMGSGPTQPFTLNTGVEPHEVEHAGYRVRLLEVSPYPYSTSQISPQSYRARLRIERTL